MYHFDNRIVITLDAGGTNLVFGAMRGCEFIVDPVTIPSRADNLDLCLQSMVNGFKTVIDLLDEKPVAISFAFPRSGRLSQWYRGRLPAQFPQLPRRCGTGTVP